MKKLLTVIALLLSFGNAFAQSDSQYSTTVVVLSPFEAASKILQTVSDVASSKLEMSASLQGRGTGGVEQLKDELVDLNEDMIYGVVNEIEDVRQPGLYELFMEISADEAQMEHVNSLVTSGSRLHRIATAVTIELMLN